MAQPCSQHLVAGTFVGLFPVFVAALVQLVLCRRPQGSEGDKSTDAYKSLETIDVYDFHRNHGAGFRIEL